MRKFCITALFFCFLVFCHVFTFLNAGFAQNTPKPEIGVALSRQNPRHLRITLTSGAATTVKISRFDLPWGYRYSMVFAAAKPNGETVELLLPVDDPGLSDMSVKSGETLTGDIDLQNVIRDLSVLKRSDVLLFWAYKAPAALRLPRWTGGLVVIPQQK